MVPNGNKNNQFELLRLDSGVKNDNNIEAHTKKACDELRENLVHVLLTFVIAMN
jgi:hypothetical protein